MSFFGLFTAPASPFQFCSCWLPNQTGLRLLLGQRLQILPTTLLKFSLWLSGSDSILHHPHTTCLKHEGLYICIICICNIYAPMCYVCIYMHRCVWYKHLHTQMHVPASFSFSSACGWILSGRNCSQAHPRADSQSPAMIPSAAWASHKLFAARICSICLWEETVVLVSKATVGN